MYGILMDNFIRAVFLAHMTWFKASNWGAYINIVLICISQSLYPKESQKELFLRQWLLYNLKELPNWNLVDPSERSIKVPPAMGRKMLDVNNFM